MSSKTVAIIVVVVVVLLGFYFYSGNGAQTVVAPASESAAVEKTETVATVPAKASSSDEIVDYLVDGLSADTKATAKASIDLGTPSQAGVADAINTNF